MNEYKILRGADGLPTLVSASSITECLAKKYSFLEFPTEVQLERVKDEKFQAMCKDLWPNIYKKMGEHNQKDQCKDLIQNLNKRIICDTAIKNALENKSNACCSGCETKTEPSYAAMDAALAGQSKNSVPNINIYINDNKEKMIYHSKPTSEIPKVSVNPQLKMSSYNFPFCATNYTEMREKQCPKKFSDILGIKVEECMSSEDEAILNSIKETQEKLKMTQRIETTTELVDDLINKFGRLQNEMKNKAIILKVKSDLQSDREKIDKEFLIRRSLHDFSSCRSVSRDSFSSRHCRSISRESGRFKSPCVSPYRSKSRECIYTNPYRSDSQMSCTIRPRSCSREHKPLKSCLKISKSPGEASVSYRIKEGKPSINASSDDMFINKDLFNIGPKVNCWNIKSKVDSNIY